MKALDRGQTPTITPDLTDELFIVQVDADGVARDGRASIGTLLEATASSQFLPWQPSTAYTAGTFVSYNGKLYSVDANFTSPGSFSTTGLTETFAPRITTRSYTATSFAVSGSGPALGSSTGCPFWALDASAVEALGIRIPNQDVKGWGTFSVVARWFNPITSSGDVTLLMESKSIPVGGTVNGSYASGSNVTTSAAAAGVEVRATLGTITVVDGEDIGIRINRIATAGADTLTTDAWFTGIDIVRAT